MSKTLSIATIVALAVMAPEAQAKCARVLLVPRVLTHAAEAIPPSGGVLVGFDTAAGAGAERYADHDPAVNPDWIVVAGKRRQRPKIEVLAPGLAVYRARLIAGARRRGLSLREGGTTLGTWKVGPGRATIATAPRATSVVTTSVTSDNLGRGVRVVTTTAVTLAAPPPPEAVAMIAYQLSGTTSTAIAWARVGAGQPDPIELYRSPGRCGTEPAGLGAPTAGDQVQLVWIDAFGRPSPRSTTITVR